MTYHLVDDGHVTFYTIEYWGGSGGSSKHKRWINGVGAFIAKVPEHLRYDVKKRRYTEPFGSYEASGELWQMTRNNGWFSRDAAMKALHTIARHNPGEKFRVVCVTMSLSRLSIAEYVVGMEQKPPK